jgi:hypothetical protein
MQDFTVYSVVLLYNFFAHVEAKFGDYKMKKLAILLTFCNLSFCAYARIIYVDADATGANNGSSWANAYNFLQDAMAVAAGGDEIRVAEGIYKPDCGGGNSLGNRKATFKLKNGVAIRGGYAGFGEPNPDTRNIKDNRTILSGDLSGNDNGFAHNGENSYHVVTGTNVSASAVLDGFIITGGNANAPVLPSSNWPNFYGGGIYIDNASPTLIRCTFKGNSALRGGGGVYCWASNSNFVNCIIEGNKCDEDGGSKGGGLSLGDYSPKLKNCLIIDNSSLAWGGGIYINNDCKPEITNCTISGNSARWGGAICSHWGCTTNLVNCIIWDNSYRYILQDESVTTITYSDVQGGWEGEGNISENPLFFDSANNDFHLLPGSPCINTGNPTGNYSGQLDIDGEPRVIGGRVDMGCDETNFNNYPIAGICQGQRLFDWEGPFGAGITLDGSCSSDLDSSPGTNDDIEYFDWYRVDPCNPDIEVSLGSGPIIDCNLPVGEHTIVLEVIDHAGACDTNEVMITVLYPVVDIIIPQPDTSLQDSATLTAEVSYMSDVNTLYFYVREPNADNGIPVGYEDLPATLDTASGRWQYSFDTTQLDDGYYVILAKIVNNRGNEIWSNIVPFSIRNWVVLELLPASKHFRAGRTVPIKFALRINETVDPAMPFVYNQELEVRIVDVADPDNTLQTSLFGDSAKDYRIDTVAELYITNFKTSKTPVTYEAQIWRNNNFLIGSFTFDTEVLGRSDLNGDGAANYDDLALMAESWLGNNTIADITPEPSGDGIVNFRDFAAFADHWLMVTGQ